MIKTLIKKNFESLAYFYTYLRYRIFIVMAFSIFIGVLDGLGLSMFLPLLQMVNDASSLESESLGKLSFLLDFIEFTGLALTLVTVLTFMSIFFFLKGVIQYVAGIYRVRVQEWFIKRIRTQNVFGLNNLAYKYFIKSDIGRIQNTLTGEVDRLAISYLNYFTAIEYGILVMVYMAFAFFIDAQFAILVTVGGILTNFLYTKLYKNTRGVSRDLTYETNKFQGLIIQNVGNYKYLKATGSLKKYGEKLEESIDKIKDSNTKIGKLESLLLAGREPILIFVVVGVIYIQTALFGSELGPILISLLFFYRALNYLMQMQFRWNKFLANSGSLENIQKFGIELRENKEQFGKSKVEKDVLNLELKNVTFYYDEAVILNDISLKVFKNETVAFVGESGSGKTTLVNIIAGLLPVNYGNYYVNDEDIQKIDVESLQSKIGYITQDPVIFNDTIYNNVTFWDTENSENKERFQKVIDQAALSEYINILPEKENTILGSNGVNLSGGQRQRISIARELYKRVEILILDEATSALDSETEKAIQNNIEKLKGEYTILIVAHRISTIKNADRIVVMKNGKITNIGDFNDLIQESGFFKKMVELQEI